MSAAFRLLALGGLLAACAAGASAQGIYTCVDANGRRITSDRPIDACTDREQKELNPSGRVRRTIGPSLTAAERAAQEEQERKAAAEKERLAEQKRIQKTLLARYPTPAAHDAERAKTLQSVQDPREKARIGARFDEEQAQLKPLWAQAAATSAAAAAPAKP